MHIILLSGGSGKRLWPLSNDIRSKQFLQLLPNENGNPESMVQRVYRQLKEVGGWSSITVAAGASQKDQLQIQLGPDVNIVIEPERRDTFPAIALACSYLVDKCSVGEMEPVVIMPVDSFVDIEYFHNISKFQDILEHETGLLLLMGALPTRPSEKYGYILPADNGAVVSDVLKFKEKPDLRTAEELIGQGALWNCGVFGLKLGYILDILKNKYEVADFSYEAMREKFMTLHKTSFDYEVVEHADRIKVLRYAGAWKDLGTWETLSEETVSNITGNARADDLCRGTYVHNELEIPLVTMGLSNTVVVASNDGILVAEKGETYRLKDYLKDLDSRPMYEEKRWGSYKVVEHSFYEDGTEALTKKLMLKAGGQISYQYHNHRKEVWTIIRGEGLLYKEGSKTKVHSGDVITISEGEKHGIMGVTDMEMIEVQLGGKLVEDDIIRLEMDW